MNYVENSLLLIEKQQRSDVVVPKHQGKNEVVSYSSFMMVNAIV